MRQPIFGILCLGALVCAEARGGRGRRKWRSPRGRRSTEPSPAPPVLEYKYSTQLDAESWVQKVEHAANMTLKQEYFPMVMFHVSWCQHCQRTLPEFERAAEMVDKAEQEGHLKGLSSPVKYFILQCDKSPAERAICEKHPAAGFPMLKLFRDQRELSFTGERWAKTMAEWSVHVSRPVLLQVESKKDLEKYNELGPLFMMKDSVAKERPLVQAWLNLAFDYIEGCFFCVVPAGSEVAGTMPIGDSVSVYGKNIEPTLYEGRMSEKRLRKWVNFNQWQVVVDMTPEKAVKLMKSGLTIVAFAYKGRRGFKVEDVDQKYRDKATKIRETGRYIFASLDTAVRENGNFLSRVFPAVSVPSIFVFNGNATLKSELLYWEDPTLQDADSLSAQAIEDLMANDWARHDNSNIAWAKGWGKWTFRFGTGTVIGFIIVVFVPLTLCCICFFCVRELMTPDDPEEKPPPQRIDSKSRQPLRNLNQAAARQSAPAGMSTALPQTSKLLQHDAAARLQAENEALRRENAELRRRAQPQEDNPKRVEQENIMEEKPPKCDEEEKKD